MEGFASYICLKRSIAYGKHNMDFGPQLGSNPRTVFTDRIEIYLICMGGCLMIIRIWELLYWNFATVAIPYHCGGICMRS